MFYACLITFGCIILGITGIVLSLIDINRYNFGLYLALLSVVGTTVSVAFWIISPRMCPNPRWVDWILVKYDHRLQPIRDFLMNLIRKQQKRFWEDDDDLITSRTRRRFRSKKSPINQRAISQNIHRYSAVESPTRTMTPAEGSTTATTVSSVPSVSRTVRIEVEPTMEIEQESY
ncbi:unnamed protein product [Auanema sp. JU1783]|nr:unnamed protein product [Auanema sp. JU1783]